MSKIHAMSEFEQLKHTLHISTMAVNNTDTANTLHPKNQTPFSAINVVLLRPKYIFKYNTNNEMYLDQFSSLGV